MATLRFALEEFRDIVSRIERNDEIEPTARYACSLVAELAYYHIPALGASGSLFVADDATGSIFRIRPTTLTAGGAAKKSTH